MKKKLRGTLSSFSPWREDSPLAGERQAGWEPAGSRERCEGPSAQGPQAAQKTHPLLWCQITMSGPFLCTCGLFNLQRVHLPLPKALPIHTQLSGRSGAVEGLAHIFSLFLTLSGWGSGGHHPLPSGSKATGLWKRNSVLQAHQPRRVGSSGLGLCICVL